MKIVYRLPESPTRTRAVSPGWTVLDLSMGLHILGSGPTAVAILSNGARTRKRGDLLIASASIVLDDGREVVIFPELDGGGAHLLPGRGAIVRALDPDAAYAPRPRVRDATSYLLPRPRAAWTETAERNLARARGAFAEGRADPDLWHTVAPLGGAWFPYGLPDSDTPGARGLEFSPGYEDSYGWLAWRLARMIERCPLLNLDPATGEPLSPEATAVNGGGYALERGAPWSGALLSKATSLPDWAAPLPDSASWDDRRLPRLAYSPGALGVCPYAADLLAFRPPNGQHLGRVSQIARALAELYDDPLARWFLRVLAADCLYAWPTSRVRAVAASAGDGSYLAGREFGWVLSTLCSAAFAGGAPSWAGRASIAMTAALRGVQMPNGLTQNYPGVAASTSGFSPNPWGEGPGLFLYDQNVAQVMEAAIVFEAASDDVRARMNSGVFANSAASWRVAGQLPHFLAVQSGGEINDAWNMRGQGVIETTFCWSALGRSGDVGAMEQTYLPGTTVTAKAADLIDALVHNADEHGINPHGIEQTGPAIAALERAGKAQS